MPRAIIDDADGTLALLRQSATQFAARRDGPADLRRKRAQAGDIDRQTWAAMAEAGWTGLLLPESLGGASLGLGEQAALSEALGYALIAEPLALVCVPAAILLANAPPSPERTRLAAGMASGDRIVVPAWQAPSITIGRDAAGLALNGDLRFVDGARSATDFLVAVASDEGAMLLSVPANQPGLSALPRPGVDGTAITSLSFNACCVAADHVLDHRDSLKALLRGPLLHARLALAAELTGIACGALDCTVDYTKTRVQFGKPIASFQAIQHRLVEMWMDAELACAALVHAVEKLSAGDGQEADLAVLAAKARAGDAAVSIGRRAVHLHGATGYTDECAIGLYLKRALNLSAALGQPEALRLEFVARERAA
jgi:alkylation response protein AidB-like acyl-CoA dehydrogenase